MHVYAGKYLRRLGRPLRDRLHHLGDHVPGPLDHHVVPDPHAEPRDLEGKRIIIPGLGSSVDVLFRKWLIEKGIDEKKIKFVAIGGDGGNC